jgi:hypothetical protein
MHLKTALRLVKINFKVVLDFKLIVLKEVKFV